MRRVRGKSLLAAAVALTLAGAISSCGSTAAAPRVDQAFSDLIDALRTSLAIRAAG